MNNSKKGLITISALALILVFVLAAGIIKDRKLNSINKEEYVASLTNSSKEESKNTKEVKAQEPPVEDKSTKSLDFYGKLKEKQPVRVLILGDGLAMSQGRNSDNGIWDQGVASLIQNTYGSKVELKSLAQSGASTTVGVNVAKNNDISNYDLVITCFGHNDNSTLVNPSQSKTNYSNILAEIKSKSPKATIIPVLPSTLALDNTYRLTIQKLAAENNLTCADMKKAFTESASQESTLLNGSLPNDKGYQIYTQTVGNIIKAGVK
ncbi:SGNH/GDSL hydrolase family protein [Clostridium sp. HBUAS56017]|uniref:SGNH/GDSL hydrolase family protein n=1 Tax=Clostridium sp. HBUAS56017 TaxID=2571128 RepID=UPI0011787BCC|nr:SGNH/GDSL hydrolase family protein [Clostridium sp. HBUAS56017]